MDHIEINLSLQSQDRLSNSPLFLNDPYDILYNRVFDVKSLDHPRKPRRKGTEIGQMNGDDV